jgi:hypothetical protein
MNARPPLPPFDEDGARRFLTNNKRDFGTSVKEIDITFPANLPEAGD